MKSPRFALREIELRPILNSGELKRAWKQKIRAKFRNQDLLDPIEHLDFHVNLEQECKNLENAISSGSYAPRPSKRMLVEKSKGICRQLVIPTVREAIVL